MGVDNYFLIPFVRGFIREILSDVETGRYPLVYDRRVESCIFWKWRILEIHRFGIDEDPDSYDMCNCDPDLCEESLPNSVREKVFQERRIRCVHFEVFSPPTIAADAPMHLKKYNFRSTVPVKQFYTYYPYHRLVAM
jgi:hypothetical protein